MSLTDRWARACASPAAKILQRILNVRISIQSLKERVLQHRGQQETAMRRISGYTVGRKVTTSKLEKRSKHKWSCRA